jgi:CCR4-NOT transcription complex subunit 1
MKDFVFDSDASKMKIAAINSIKSLSGSLATVTCKDPLKLGFFNLVKDEVAKKGLEYPQESHSKLNELINSILEIGCFYIQSYVVSRAIEKIEHDEVIKTQIEKREKGLLQEINENDPQICEKVLQLPEPLKPNINGLTPEQIKIYEDFNRINFNMRMSGES